MCINVLGCLYIGSNAVLFPIYHSLMGFCPGPYCVSKVHKGYIKTDISALKVEQTLKIIVYTQIVIKDIL